MSRRIFGAPVPLEGRIPDFFSISISFLELHGAKDQIEELRNQFEKGDRLDFSSKDDIFNIAGAFRLWLQSMPEPLIPFDFYNKVIDFGKTIDPSSKKSLAGLRKLMSSLPPLRLNMMVHLCRLLRLIAVNSDVNKMTAENLAIVVTPNLLRSDHPSVSVDTLTETTIATKVVTILIHNYPATLEGLEVAAPVPAPAPVAAADSNKPPAITITAEVANGGSSTPPGVSPRDTAGLAEEVHETKKRRPSISRNKPSPQFGNALAWLVDANKNDGLDSLVDPNKAVQQADDAKKKKEEEEKEIRRLAEEEFKERERAREAAVKKEEEKAKKEKEKIRKKAERLVDGKDED